MTQNARRVLNDCKLVLRELQSEPRGAQFRIRWVAAVALLRAVGHVLSKEDSRAGLAMAQAVDSEWDNLKTTKPEPRIFWQFIEDERNNVLKAYQFRAGQSVIIRIGGPTTYTYEMTSGPFVGRDPRALVSEAIDWWELYLDKVDRRAASVT